MSWPSARARAAISASVRSIHTGKSVWAAATFVWSIVIALRRPFPAIASVPSGIAASMKTKPLPAASSSPVGPTCEGLNPHAPNIRVTVTRRIKASITYIVDAPPNWPMRDVMTSIEDLERAIATALASNRFKIPPYPAVAAKLESLARQRNGATINQLVSVISADACLAAQVLGRAQSAANSNGRAVTTLFEALSRVGLDTLVQMALATGLGSEVIAPGALAELRRDMWRRGLLSAHLARMLANNRGVSEETAYSAGLIHDLGSAIVVTTLEDLAKQLPLPVLPEASWRQLVRSHQVAFGMVIASRWKLPDTLTEVIAHGHDETSQQSPLVQLIQLSDRIVARLDGTPTTGIAAMMDFPELSEIERCTIGSVVQEVVKNMASYNEVRATKTVPSNVAVEPPANGLLPVAFEVTPEHKTMLANVRSCERTGTRYAITVQPFALAARPNISGNSW